MDKIAIIYSFNTKRTCHVAEKIFNELGENTADKINAEELSAEIFNRYKNFILGVPTWFDGELPNYWDEFVPELEDMDLNGKTFAIFGNGDQVKYSENFVDAIGIMADLLTKQGAKVVGFTSAEGYTFERSRALRDGKFAGLAIDDENQPKLTEKRVKDWVNEIKKAF